MNKRIPLFALLTASFISITGDTLASLAIPWFVLQTTGSPAQAGLTAFFSILPIVLATFFGGVIVDRVGYKPISLIADLASGLTIALIPLLHTTIGLEFWQLLLLVFLGNLFDAPGATARSALLPDLAAQAELPLEQATTWQDGVSRATRMIGAPLGGVLIASLGPILVLWLDAISFFVSLLLIALAVHQPNVDRAKDETASSSYLTDLWVGLHFILRHRLILSLIITVTITNMLDGGLSLVILPVYAQQIYGETQGAIQLGLIIGVSGGAALLGTLMMGLIGHRYSRRWLLIGAFIIVSLRWFLLAYFPVFWLLLTLLGLLSLAIGPLNPILSTVFYERIPTDIRARVLGTITAAVLVTTPLGGLSAGFLLETIGLQSTLLLFGILYLIVTAQLAVNPALRGMDDAFS